MDEEGDARVGKEVKGFPRRGVGGHYYGGAWVEGRVWEIGVIHKGDVRGKSVAGC